ncbi:MULTISPECIES: 30S ribosomal protein S14 [Gimesia]|jgi:small subunit ribosomal protein S14|uniref:Small ribosomal subunit protein uS14 n=2 Tax=Gimesia TaxID=1649453 RepID=A0A517VNE6_9PLAN|nr:MULTISPECIES: 30S ribosomal protein S14 [Gimesia]HAW31977.1 30S ribosomal protein S14 [Planctomycetaceae bacterium]EDL60965.1 30S ribosomal protein S14 [Gimesia maris DSM 8797]MAC53540.1 30S ribosomal protein S14 [Gimesia sp.]MAX38467.1 30S ribosomal protein S14 [Gimesia sp.]QDT82321.1 Alternate 30S ribosomal protein S14 [Gimesia maris]|tara:strand:- start:318 stop:587 length:270 start_codon:yes stop_codon:yes gene_type:complete
MASKSKIEKQKRNAKLVEKYAAVRAELVAKGDYEGLAKLPRSSSKTRLRRLCQLTGRPRGNYRKFQISRIALRDMALDGLIPGMKKSSW